jgi:anion-transporting  ArsA/GET3 family ATPase
VDLIQDLASEFARVTIREERSLDHLKTEIPENQWARVPYLNEEVVDLTALKKVASHIFM